MILWDAWRKQTKHFANFLSIARGILGVSLPLFIISENFLFNLAALVIFLLGVLTDYWDGYFARRYGFVSDFGKIVDPITDKILILVPLVTFALLRLISPWWVLPIVLREILITFLRIGWLMEGKVIAAEGMGKWKFASQVSVLSIMFLDLAFFRMESVAWLLPGARLLMLVLLVVAVALTLLSGASFLRLNRRNFESKSFARYVAALGVGLLPLIPGTWGSLAGVGLYALAGFNFWLVLSLFLFLSWVGFWSYPRLGDDAGEDPPFVVVDEACGIFLTVMFVPFTFTNLVLGFFLFRFFDIFKPFPVRQFERLPAFWGVLADDLAAGLYAFLSLSVLQLFVH